MSNFLAGYQAKAMESISGDSGIRAERRIASPPTSKAPRGTECRSKIFGTAVLLGVGMVSPLFAEGPAAQLAQVKTSQLVSFPSGGTVSVVNSYGELYIEGWDRAEVEATVIRSTHYFESEPKDKQKERLAAITVAAERRSDKELALTTELPHHWTWARRLSGSTRGGVTMEYRIYVPRDVRLVINHRGGSVIIGNVKGEVDAANRDGDIFTDASGQRNLLDTCDKQNAPYRVRFRGPYSEPIPHRSAIHKHNPRLAPHPPRRGIWGCYYLGDTA